MTKHTEDTQNPQTYWQHFQVAFFGSFELVAYGIGGMLHALLPEIKCLQFWTSSGILKYAKALEDSRRHDEEIKTIWNEERLRWIELERNNHQNGE